MNKHSHCLIPLPSDSIRGELLSTEHRTQTLFPPMLSSIFCCGQASPPYSLISDHSKLSYALNTNDSAKHQDPLLLFSASMPYTCSSFVHLKCHIVWQALIFTSLNTVLLEYLTSNSSAYSWLSYMKQESLETRNGILICVFQNLT